MASFVGKLEFCLCWVVFFVRFEMVVGLEGNFDFEWNLSFEFMAF